MITCDDSPQLCRDAPKPPGTPTIPCLDVAIDSSWISPSSRTLLAEGSATEDAGTIVNEPPD